MTIEVLRWSVWRADLRWRGRLYRKTEVRARARARVYEGWGKWLVGEGSVVRGDVRDAKVYRVRLSMFGSRRGWAE